MARRLVPFGVGGICMEAEEMKVMEVYDGFQGEGQFIGQPSVFVRLFGCNMRCSWCDTAYAINRKEWKRAEFAGPVYEELTVEQVLSRIELLGLHFIVITGGEPTMQGDLTRLLQRLYVGDYLVTVETNATIIPPGLMEWYDEEWDKASLLWSLSPKLGSAAEGGRAWVDEDFIRWFVAWTRAQLKFVIAKRSDLTEALELVRNLTMSPLHVPIIFQPEGSAIISGVEGYVDELKQLQDLVGGMNWPKYDFRVLPQLHVLLYGQRRFV